MRIFVGYGYNERDAWIEQHVEPILRAMSIDTVDGKDMHGEVLQEGVKNRIDIADAVNYRARINGIPSQSRSGRLERQDNSLFLDAIGLPSNSFVEIEGTTTTDGVLFNTGWVSADLVRIEF